MFRQFEQWCPNARELPGREIEGYSADQKPLWNHLEDGLQGMNWDSLTSGMAGALVGAVAGSAATYLAVVKQIRHERELAKEERWSVQCTKAVEIASNLPLDLRDRLCQMVILIQDFMVRRTWDDIKLNRATVDVQNYMSYVISSLGDYLDGCSVRRHFKRPYLLRDDPEVWEEA